MKIATFNVNGINGRLPVLLRWLEKAQPDVVCLQELKAPEARFPIREIEKANYGAICKLRWFRRLTDYAAELLALDVPVVLAGDYNVMPTEFDVYKPERWVDDALFRPEVRRAFGLLVSQGWTDALRALHPGERIYTFWDYFRDAWGRDAGLRLDHLLLSPAVAKRLVAADVDRTVRGWDRASDHAPVWIELSETAQSAPQARPSSTD
ncbi:MAG: exodeoxyribonuclease [Xanthobacteraceae bacterium]|nr:exodeoxyribonuclease [Xanthobacteraceae bacterium]